MELAQDRCTDLPASNVMTLAATAVARARYPWLDFQDPVAERVWRRLGADATLLSDTDLRAAIHRTLLLDKYVRRWAHPRREACLVEIGAGLSTRHARLAGIVARMVAVDEASIAAVRREVFAEPRPFRQIGAALERRDWMRNVVTGSSAPLFVVVEDAFLDLHPADVLAILGSLSAELPSESLVAASYGARTRMVVAHPDSRRPTLEVQTQPEHTGTTVARFPRLNWLLPPGPLDGAELASVALLRVI